MNSFSTLFYIKDERRDKNGKAGLYLRITVHGRRTSISLNRKINPSKWDSRMNKMRGKCVEAEELNRFMTTSIPFSHIVAWVIGHVAYPK